MAADINFRSRRVNVSAVPGDAFSFTVVLENLGYTVAPTATATFGAVSASVGVTYSATDGSVTILISLSGAQTTTLATTQTTWSLVVTASGGAPRTFLSGDYVGDADPIKSTPRAAHRIVPYDSVGTVTITGGSTFFLNQDGQFTPGGTDVPVADGGTGASDATTARTNLGVPGIPVPIADGGTAGTSAGTARVNLEVQRSHMLDMRDYLAYDGTTNDTTALATLVSNIGSAGSHLHFPAGTCLITPGQITFGQGTFVSGDGFGLNTSDVGPGVSTIQASAGTGTLLTMAKGGTMRDICLRGTLTSGADGVLYGGGTANRGGMQNVRVVKFDNNIVIDNAWINSFHNCHVAGAVNAGYLLSTKFGNTVTISGGLCEWNGIGVKIVPDESIHVTVTLLGVTIEGSDTQGILVSGGAYPAAVRGVNVYGCYFEANAQTDNTAADAADIYVVGATHNGINILASSFATTKYGIVLDGGIGTWVQGNTFMSTGPTGYKAIKLTANTVDPVIGINGFYDGRTIEDNMTAVRVLARHEASGIKILTGTGQPEGFYSAPIGSLFLSQNGSTSTTLYVKTSGTGVFGWTAK